VTTDADRGAQMDVVVQRPSVGSPEDCPSADDVVPESPADEPRPDRRGQVARVEVPLSAPVEVGAKFQPLGLPAGRTALRIRLLTLDVLATVISWVALGLVLNSSDGLLDRLESGVVAMFGTLVAMRVAGLYRSRICARRSGEVGRIFIASVFGAALFVVVQWSATTPGPQAAICGLASVILVSVLRWHYSRWLRRRRSQGMYLRRVLLVGVNQDAGVLLTMLKSEPGLGYVVAGIVGDHIVHPSWALLPRVTTVAEVPALARSTGSSGVVIVPNALTNGDANAAIAQCMSSGLHVLVWSGFFGVGSRRLRHVPVSGEPFFYVEPRSTELWQRACKRTLDIVGATLGLLLTVPLLLVSALAVKMEGGGPILHRQLRVGLNGAQFTVYKLRTMAHDTEGDVGDLATLNLRTDGPLFKASLDPRVTRLGRFLRAFSIDELPQLFNVLEGKMSLVGPRPALPHEAAQFDQEFQRRHSMRPGMTGLWQIEARENPSFNAYRRLDLNYIDNWSLSLDISILSATIPVAGAHAVRAIRSSTRRGQTGVDQL